MGGSNFVLCCCQRLVIAKERSLDPSEYSQRAVQGHGNWACLVVCTSGAQKCSRGRRFQLCVLEFASRLDHLLQLLDLRLALGCRLLRRSCRLNLQSVCRAPPQGSEAHESVQLLSCGLRATCPALPPCRRSWGQRSRSAQDPFVAAEGAILACALHDDRPSDVHCDGVTNSWARQSAPVEDPVILTAISKTELLLESSFFESTNPAVVSRHSVKDSHCELRKLCWCWCPSVWYVSVPACLTTRRAGGKVSNGPEHCNTFPRSAEYFVVVDKGC